MQKTLFGDIFIFNRKRQGGTDPIWGAPERLQALVHQLSTNFQPVYVSLLFVLTDMINSTIYTPSPKMGIGRGLNRSASEAAWRCILRPKEVGKLTVAECFFEDAGRHWCHETMNEGEFGAEPEEYQNEFDYEGAPQPRQNCVLILLHR